MMEKHHRANVVRTLKAARRNWDLF